jgi:branched-chain amino acid transport system substrate-binding protein
MKARGFGVLTLAAAVACGLLAGCSSSGNKGSTSTSTSPAASTSPSASSTGATGSPVSVGAIGSFTGPYASSTGGIPKVLSAWENALNAAGGVNGHKVNLIAKDAGTTPGANLTAAKELIGQDHVVAIIDIDAADSAWLPYASSQKVPVIVGYPSVTALADPTAFPIMASPFVITYAFAVTAKAAGPKFGLAYCAEGSGCSQLPAILKALSAPLGLAIPVSLQASSTAPDYTAVCQGLKNAKVNSYLLQFAGAAATRITDTCYQQGLHVPQVLEGPNSLPAWKSDKAFDGDPVIDGVTPYFESNTPAQKAYRAALSKYAPSIVGSPLDNSYSTFAWLTGQLFAAAAQNVSGPITATSLTSALYTLKNETLGGMTQPLNYVQGKPTSLNCYFTWKISGGTFVAGPTGDTPTCAPAAVINPLIAAAAKAAGS